MQVCLSLSVCVSAGLSLSLYASISHTFKIFFPFLSLSISVYNSLFLSYPVGLILSVFFGSSSSDLSSSFSLSLSLFLFLSRQHSLSLCLVLSRQGDRCRIEAQVRSLFIPSVVMFSRLSSYLSVSS